MEKSTDATNIPVKEITLFELEEVAGGIGPDDWGGNPTVPTTVLGLRG